MPLNAATRKTLILLGAAVLIAVALLILRPNTLALVLLAFAGISVLTWGLSCLPRGLLVGLSLLVLLSLGQWVHLAYGLEVVSLPDLARSWFGPLLFTLPVLGAVLAMVLVSGVFGEIAIPPAPDEVSRLPMMARSALALLLVGVLAADIYWASVWDQTTDGTGGISTAGAASLSAVAAGAILELRLAGRRRSVSRLFTLLILLVLFGAFLAGNGADYHALTARRAERIQAALEDYKARHGSYPPDLQELAPGYLLAIPSPAIFPGEGWCYQASPHSYQLATYYRRYFSTPFSLRVYAAAGDPPATDAACQNHLVELKHQYDPIAYPGP
jgi:hypothetical protein